MRYRQIVCAAAIVLCGLAVLPGCQPPGGGGNKNRPGAAGNPITVRVMSRLGAGQVRESTTITIDGVTQTIHLDENGLRQSGVDFRLPGTGTFIYTASSQTSYQSHTRQGQGQGQITVTGDSTFEVFMVEAPTDPFGLYLQQHYQQAPQNVQTSLGHDFKKVQKQRKLVTVTAGVTAKVKVARTIEHALMFQVGGELMTDVQAGVPLVVGGAIKTKLSSSVNRKWTDSVVVEDEVLLDGNKSTKYEIIWYDHVRTGSVSFLEGGLNRFLGFEFAETTEFEVRSLSN